MITLTNYDNTDGNASKILVIDKTLVKIYDTDNTDITSSLASIISGKSALETLVGTDYVDLFLLACDCPLYSQTDKEAF